MKALPPGKRLLKLVGRATFWWLSRAAGLLRPWSIKLFGDCLAMAFYRVSKRHRGTALRNLRAAFGAEKSEREIENIAKGVFKHFTRGALEFFWLLSLDRDRVGAMIDIEGRENLDEALSHGKGCIVVTAHYGNWELLAREFASLGYGLNVIARGSDDPGITDIATKIREGGGYKVFDRDQPIIGAFRALRKNEILGILPDQNDIDGVFVDFFGRPAATAVGPAVLALKSGAPIVPAFAPRIGNSKYVAKIQPRIVFEPTGDEQKDTHALMTLVNKSIEDEIRRNPSQWLWLHDRWKLTPEAPSSGN